MTTQEYIAQVRERLAKATPDVGTPLFVFEALVDCTRLCAALERAVEEMKRVHKMSMLGTNAISIEASRLLNSALADIERILSGGKDE